MVYFSFNILIIKKVVETIATIQHAQSNARAVATHILGAQKQWISFTRAAAGSNEL